MPGVYELELKEAVDTGSPGIVAVFIFLSFFSLGFIVRFGFENASEVMVTVASTHAF